MRLKNTLLPLLMTAGAAHACDKTPVPKNGDVLRVNRGLYSHYGDFNGIVRETSLDEFLNGAKNFSVCNFPEHPLNLPAVQTKNPLAKILQFVRVLKLMDYHLYSGDEAVERARSKLGQGGYNLALNNCEHFAVWCRTGVKDSSQVNHILDIITHLLG